MSIFFKVFFAITFMFLTSCSTGQEGDVFLRIRAVLEPNSFSINSNDIPSNFEYDVFYEIKPGYYDFEYIDHEYIAHPQLGELSVLEATANMGTDGGIFKSSIDGEDVYIDLILLSSGPIIETYNYFTIASTLNY